jgi:hypothetical protein
MNGFRKLSLFIESYGPAACGILTLICLWVSRGRIITLMVEDKISIDNLFSAIFGWAAIQTGCVFAIYGFIAGKTDGFIGEARNTRSMRRYNVFIKRAIASGFILTIGSMPLIVWKLKIGADDIGIYMIIAIWFSVFVWAFLSFARVAYIFGLLIRVEDQKRIPAD